MQVHVWRNQNLAEQEVELKCSCSTHQVSPQKVWSGVALLTSSLHPERELGLACANCLPFQCSLCQFLKRNSSESCQPPILLGPGGWVPHSWRRSVTTCQSAPTSDSPRPKEMISLSLAQKPIFFLLVMTPKQYPISYRILTVYFRTLSRICPSTTALF